MNTQENIISIIGPCSLESESQIFSVAELYQQYDLSYLRTPLFKPRTNPNSFQGLGKDGLKIIKKLKETYPRLKNISEVCSVEQFKIAKNHIDIVQIGSRNMQNFELLKYIGAHSNNHDYVMLKRGFCSTLDEWIYAAEYLMKAGLAKSKILLCERGIRDAAGTNNVILDLATAFKASQLGFKVIIDPSHGTKERALVLPLLDAAKAMGFAGYMVEVHPFPEKSVSDANQALSIKDFYDYLNKEQSNYQLEHYNPLESSLHRKIDQSERYKN